MRPPRDDFTPPVEARPARPRLYLPSRAGRRWLFVSIWLAFCGSLLWLAGKSYWWFTAAVPPTQAPSVWDHHFPLLRRSGLLDQVTRHEDDRFDVLLLGGSVLVPGWTRVQAELEQRLAEALPERYRLFNLGESGYTSRDSLIQYEHLADHQFDLVLVYDGINDVRMNCCPPEEFRDDYTHFSRYAAIGRHLAAGQINLPRAALDRLQVVVGTLPYGTTHPQLLQYGANSQSARTLAANVAEITRLARERHDPLLLLTYAWYIPADYSEDRFKGGELDYGQENVRACTVEIWGNPPDVIQALTLQNDRLRELAARSPEVIFVDLARALPATGAHFVDPCHLTQEGSRRWVELIWPSVERHLHAWQSTP
jgi:lysophospholipase L1-like esterase